MGQFKNNMSQLRDKKTLEGGVHVKQVQRPKLAFKEGLTRTSQK